jgi:uncharacterized RDD family membrane protein YckC
MIAIDTANSWTRSFRRRVIAFLIDLFLASIVAAALLFPFAGSLDSKFRAGIGFHWQACGPGKAYNKDGTELLMTGWQAVHVCDLRQDFVFPRRTATFIRSTTTKSGTITSTRTEYVGFDVDSANRVVTPIDISALQWLVFILIAAGFEASRFSATPGKMILGLAVESSSGGRANWVQALIRNSLKFLVLVFNGLLAIPLLAGWYQFDIASTIQQDNTVVLPKEILAAYTPIFVIFAIIAVAQAVLVFSILFPWSSKGRALYDRIAGTRVIRMEV